MMRLNREFTYAIGWALDNLIPPIIRDNRIFMRLVLRILLRDKVDVFMRFKELAHELSEDDIKKIYCETQHSHIQRETDLSQVVVHRLIKECENFESVLDISCGSGYFCRKLRTQNKYISISGADIVQRTEEISGVDFYQCNIEETGFSNSNFDIVISSHTLEHVFDFEIALKEIRRVAKKKIIIVLPIQRSYQYTFDLHLHFFPYRHDVLNKIRPQGEFTLDKIGGEWVYVENL